MNGRRTSSLLPFLDDFSDCVSQIPASSSAEAAAAVSSASSSSSTDHALKTTSPCSLGSPFFFSLSFSLPSPLEASYSSICPFPLPWKSSSSFPLPWKRLLRVYIPFPLLHSLRRIVMHRGPRDTAYEDGVFVARLSFPKDYPMSPPKMRFVTELFHPNSSCFLPFD